MKTLQYDEIHVENLEVFANHGVFPEETSLGQKFVISLTMYVDTRKAGKRTVWKNLCITGKSAAL